MKKVVQLTLFLILIIITIIFYKIYFSDKKENPDESDNIEEEKTMHQKMYEIATARYNPFSLGGSENCDSDVSCNIGGSEEAHK